MDLFCKLAAGDNAQHTQQISASSHPYAHYIHIAQSVSFTMGQHVPKIAPSRGGSRQFIQVESNFLKHGS